jgi:hypothetical protein
MSQMKIKNKIGGSKTILAPYTGTKSVINSLFYQYAGAVKK